MDLKLLVKRLEEFAPLKTSTDWDNVGLLVEPSEHLIVKKILVTNDLTEPVLDEALKLNANLIISYHPAIFKPLKRLTQSEWKQRSIVKCIENKVAVFTPHTTWDSIDGGINDWILESFETTKVESVRKNPDVTTITKHSKSVKIIVEIGVEKEKFLNKVKSLDETEVKLVSENELQNNNVDLEFLTSADGVTSLIDQIKTYFGSSVLNSLRIFELDKPLMKNVGLGRIGYLKEPIKISEIINRMKSLLKMNTFRLALANGKTTDDYVKVLAIGAGTSTNLLNNTKADFIITGEISHHEILHEVHRGVSLIVTDHSNTERGYIEIFKKKFTELLKKNNESVEIFISQVDRDPLAYV